MIPVVWRKPVLPPCACSWGPVDCAQYCSLSGLPLPPLPYAAPAGSVASKRVLLRKSFLLCRSPQHHQSSERRTKLRKVVSELLAHVEEQHRSHHRSHHKHRTGSKGEPDGAGPEVPPSPWDEASVRAAVERKVSTPLVAVRGRHTAPLIAVASVLAGLTTYAYDCCDTHPALLHLGLSAARLPLERVESDTHRHSSSCKLPWLSRVRRTPAS